MTRLVTSRATRALVLTSGRSARADSSRGSDVEWLPLPGTEVYALLGFRRHVMCCRILSQRALFTFYKHTFVTSVLLFNAERICGAESADNVFTLFSKLSDESTCLFFRGFAEVNFVWFLNPKLRIVFLFLYFGYFDESEVGFPNVDSFLFLILNFLLSL